MKKQLKKFFKILGPGLVTGAADDDPSGIATYSIAGSATGTNLLWSAFLTWPLMAGVQMMCARIGIVTEKGLTQVLAKKFPKSFLILLAILLLIANVVNIAADLAGMADAVEVLSGFNSSSCIIIFGCLISYAIIKFRYQQIANVLKWLTLSLFTYISVAFLIKPDWSLILKQTLTFKMPQGQEWSMLVAILGTTISPYLFFWQTAQEKEEKIKAQLSERALDVGVGTFLSNLVMFFIILTTALTLNKAGITNITSTKEAAEALRPLAGDSAMLLFTIGIISVGFLAIPTLAASSAYAFAEIFNWRQGLDSKFREAPTFYTIIMFSIAVAILLDSLNINPLKTLFYSSIVNGLIAPILLVGIFLVARDKKIMNNRPSSKLNQVVVLLTIILMTAAAIAMIVG